jgi:hypothetical protein
VSGNGDPKASSTVVIGVVGALVLVVIVIALQALYYRAEQAEVVRKVYQAAPEEWSRLRAEQEARLHAYRWVDKQKGVVAVPIDRAIELLVRGEAPLTPEVPDQSGAVAPAPPAEGGPP